VADYKDQARGTPMGRAWGLDVNKRRPYMKWIKQESALVTAFAYMVHYKRISSYQATKYMQRMIRANRSWESIRSQLNRERKAILWESTPPLGPFNTIEAPYHLDPRYVAKVIPYKDDPFPRLKCISRNCDELALRGSNYCSVHWITVSAD